MDGITVESEAATTTTTTATRQWWGTHRNPTTARSRSKGYPSVNYQHSDVAALRTTAPRTPVDTLHPPGQPPQCRKSGRLRSPAYEQSYHRAPSGLLPAPRRRLRSVSPVSATSFASGGVRPLCVSKRQISLRFEFHSTQMTSRF